MKPIPFTAPPSSKIKPCPRCGQNQKFHAHSQQVCEDGCEIWITCICKCDPTRGSAHRRRTTAMRRAVPSIFGGAANAESHAGSLHPLVSPWIRAALVRDAGRLGLRGQRDARSNAEKSFDKCRFVVDGNKSAVYW